MEKHLKNLEKMGRWLQYYYIVFRQERGELLERYSAHNWRGRCMLAFYRLFEGKMNIILVHHVNLPIYLDKSM